MAGNIRAMPNAISSDDGPWRSRRHPGAAGLTLANKADGVKLRGFVLAAFASGKTTNATHFWTGADARWMMNGLAVTAVTGLFIVKTGHTRAYHDEQRT